MTLILELSIVLAGVWLCKECLLSTTALLLCCIEMVLLRIIGWRNDSNKKAKVIYIC